MKRRPRPAPTKPEERIDIYYRTWNPIGLPFASPLADLLKELERRGCEYAIAVKCYDEEWK